MSDIEKCVCGGEAAFYYECPLTSGDFVECPDCERMGPAVRGKEAAIAAWNHDQRGLQLLLELVAIRDRALPSGMIYTGKESRELVDLMQKADAWAKEGDRDE